MADENNKYSNNRNLWRKVYGFRRRKPVTQQFVDSHTQVTFSYNLQATIRHRDFFLIDSTITASILIPVTSAFAEYDEGLIAFNNTDEETANFSFVFSNTPDAVVLTIDPPALSDDSDFVIPYGVSFDDTSLTVGLSAPYSGNIRYRAVYSSTGYPTTATSSLVPTSGTFTLSAGSVVVSDATAYTASFDTLTSTPSLFYNTPWGIANTTTQDVFLDVQTTNSASATGEISSTFTNTIYFIAVE